jgi:hypothetical protein
VLGSLHSEGNDMKLAMNILSNLAEFLVVAAGIALVLVAATR